MRKFRLIIFVVLLASLVLAGCKPQNTATPEPAAAAQPTATEAAAESGEAEVVSQPVSSGEFVCNVVKSLIPDIPEDQIPPIPLASEEDHVLGDLDAEFQIIVYTDFQCPYCSMAAPQLEAFQADYADRVNLVVRHLPLITIHDKAMQAARAAEAAGAQGQFFEMHDILFGNQSVWAQESMTTEMFDEWVSGQAEELGLDMDAFDEVYNSEETQAKLDAQYTQATQEIGISGTPTVFIVINGVPYSASYGYESLAGILRLIDLDKNLYTECPPMTIDADKSYTATISTTKGDIVVELYADKAPNTVNSFIFLANDGYFNNVIWHRVIPDFVAQAGDPSGSGLGGPGYQYSNEISDLTFDGAGVLGMAHSSAANSNGSQFFITYNALPNLDGDYTVFGKVIEGLDVVSSLNAVDPEQGSSYSDSDMILSVKITEK